jgi:hypothetical protein
MFLAMKYFISVLVIIILSGCSAKFNYVKTSDNDVEFTFGDRFGGKGFYTPNRNVLISLKDNNCTSYTQIGLMTKNSLVPADETKSSYLPSGQEIFLKGTYSYNTGSKYFSCESAPVSFSPQSGKKYSVDVYRLTHICALSVKEILPDGSYSTEDVPTNYLKQCK